MLLLKMLLGQNYDKAYGVQGVRCKIVINPIGRDGHILWLTLYKSSSFRSC